MHRYVFERNALEKHDSDASRFLVLYLYESGFRHLDMGYASAIAWALFVLLAVLCLALVALTLWTPEATLVSNWRKKLLSLISI